MDSARLFFVVRRPLRGELTRKYLNNVLAFVAFPKVLFLTVFKTEVGFPGFCLRQVEQSQWFDMFHLLGAPPRYACKRKPNADRVQLSMV